MESINLVISEPLGWILKQCGQLIPFGLAPIGSESSLFGDPKEWKEVKVTPSISILTCESELRCPADCCGQKLTKHHHSFDAHVREHVGLKKSEALNTNRTSDNKEVPFNYYCNHKGCIYSMYDGDRFFTKMKYLKQHYLKVHAPKTFVCPQCQKSFGTAVFLEIHSRMCGQHFICSCNSSYSTLEALQTHARRKCHTYDHAGYKNILKSVKQANLATKTDEEKPVDLLGKKTKKQQPYALLPKPNGIVGNLVSPWVFDECSFPLKVDFGTQTSPMNSSHHNSKAASHDSQKMTKRKKSAETQTSQVRVRISTETQTANVIKRRRSNRKKQLVEAETQCQTETEKLIMSSNLRDPTVEYKTRPDYLMDPFLLYAMGTAKETNNRTNTTGSLLDEMTGYDVKFERNASSETIIENILRDLEVHSQTQTDPYLFSGVDESSILDDIGVGINLNVVDTDVSEFLNFVTTETQTLPGIVISPSVMNVNANSSPTDTANTQTNDNIGFPADGYGNSSMELDQMLDDIFPCQKLQTADSVSANASYLETMDNETQTQVFFSSKQDRLDNCINQILSLPGMV